MKKTLKFMSSSESSLAKRLHHWKRSTQFTSMPESTRTNCKLQQKQSLNQHKWMIRWIPPSMSRMILTCIINFYYSSDMHARKWLSNSTHVLKKKFPKKIVSVKLTSIMKIFRQRRPLEWFRSLKLMCLFNTKPPPTDLLLTKRNVLKNIATLFDPLSLQTSYTIRAQILLQVIWTRGLN